MTQETLQYHAFRAIRHHLNDLNLVAGSTGAKGINTAVEINNEELAGFIKGVCALERLISLELEGEEHRRRHEKGEFAF